VAARFGKVHEEHETPYVADNIITIAAVITVIVFYIASGFKIDGFTVFYYIGTLGTLGLIVVYLLTSISAVAYFGVKKKVWTWQNIAPVIASILLLYVLWSNVSPSALSWPFNILPYIALAFIIVGSLYTYAYIKKSGKLVPRLNVR